MFLPSQLIMSPLHMGLAYSFLLSPVIFSCGAHGGMCVCGHCDMFLTLEMNVAVYHIISARPQEKAE